LIKSAYTVRDPRHRTCLATGISRWPRLRLNSVDSWKKRRGSGVDLVAADPSGASWIDLRVEKRRSASSSPTGAGRISGPAARETPDLGRFGVSTEANSRIEVTTLLI
jgi:hypothetical protein